MVWFSSWVLSLISVFGFIFGFSQVVGVALRGALRSPQGGALRAKRRARPTTAAATAGGRPTLPSRSLVGAPPIARGDPPGAPTSASPGAVLERLLRGEVPGRPRLSASEVAGSPASAARNPGIRLLSSRPALRTPPLGLWPARSADSGARAERSGCHTAPPNHR